MFLEVALEKIAKGKGVRPVDLVLRHEAARHRRVALLLDAHCEEALLYLRNLNYEVPLGFVLALHLNQLCTSEPISMNSESLLREIRFVILK